MPSERVLVVTPTYNGAAYIEETIRSVQGQAHSHWTMVVVSDGSTDATHAIVEKFAERDPRIHLLVLDKNNGCPAVPRNRGVQWAVEKGLAFEYLAFLDDDDIWLPEKLATQVAVFREDSELGILNSGWISYFKGEHVTHIKRRDIRTVRDQLFFAHIGLSVTLLKREKVERFFPLFDEDPYLKAIEDYELWVRLLANGVKCGTHDSKIFLYRVRETSITAREFSEKLRRWVYVYARIAMKYRQIPFPQLALAAALRTQKYFLEACLEKLQPGRANVGTAFGLGAPVK